MLRMLLRLEVCCYRTVHDDDRRSCGRLRLQHLLQQLLLEVRVKNETLRRGTLHHMSVQHQRDNGYSTSNHDRNHACVQSCSGCYSITADAAVPLLFAATLAACCCVCCHSFSCFLLLMLLSVLLVHPMLLLLLFSRWLCTFECGMSPRFQSSRGSALASFHAVSAVFAKKKQQQQHPQERHKQCNLAGVTSVLVPPPLWVFLLLCWCGGRERTWNNRARDQERCTSRATANMELPSPCHSQGDKVKNDCALECHFEARWGPVCRKTRCLYGFFNGV